MVEPGDFAESYRAGVGKLLELLGPGHACYNDVLIFQMRLEENLQEERLLGATAESRARRHEVLRELNHLAQQTLSTDFIDLCPASDTTRKAPEEIFREASRQWILGDLGYALQLFKQVQQRDPFFPRIDAMVTNVTKEMTSKYVSRDGYVIKDSLFGEFYLPGLLLDERFGSRPREDRSLIALIWGKIFRAAAERHKTAFLNEAREIVKLAVMYEYRGDMNSAIEVCRHLLHHYCTVKGFLVPDRAISIICSIIDRAALRCDQYQTAFYLLGSLYPLIVAAEEGADAQEAKDLIVALQKEVGNRAFAQLWFDTVGERRLPDWLQLPTDTTTQQKDTTDG